MQGLVAITAFREGKDTDLIERTRAEVFIDTAQACSDRGIPLVGVYKECTPAYVSRIASTGAILRPQSSRSATMGAVRREAIRVGLGSLDAPFYLWLEPEKSGLPACLDGLRLNPTSEFCFLNRRDMGSYPPEQADYYLFCRHAAHGLLGVDIDYAFGPMIFSRRTAKFFLDYDGRYGDKWDAILIPRIPILRSGLPYDILSVPFRNDPRMTAVEMGNPRIILKRLEQLNNVIPSLVQECSFAKPL